jgi:hypothetical protein
MEFSFWCALIKPPEEHSTPGSLKALHVSLVEPVAYLKDRVILLHFFSLHVVSEAAHALVGPFPTDILTCYVVLPR